MPLTVLTIPCLSDNYAFVLHNADTGATALVDAPEAAPILAALDQRGWTLTDVVLTHHHHDHVQGLGPLRDRFSPRVIGAAADAHRLPALDLEVSEGDMVTICGETAHVYDVSGHTLGHIALHFADSRAAYTADSLMALGCGRLFEGTPAQMWDSLQKLRALPDDTTIYSGHEYTAANAKFALTIEPDNSDLILRVKRVTEARANATPTVPSTLAEEKATNPFLRADVAALKMAVGMNDAEAADVFAHVRAAKDNF